MTIDERHVTIALQTYARGIDVTDADLDRLEALVNERLHPARRSQGHRRPWEWAVAACAVVALVLAVAALWRTPAAETVPASPTITPSDLAGLWLVDEQGDDWVWELSADGRLAMSSTASAYINRYHHTTFTLEGDVLSFRDRGELCRSTVGLSAEGRMLLTPLGGPVRCRLWDPVDGGPWPFIRVSPASLPGAMLTVRNPDRQRAPTEPGSMTDVVGTWLLRGTGTILVVVRTSPGVGEYVLDDDGDGQVDPDQQGTFVLRPDGGVVLRTERGAEQACDTVYSRVVTSGAILEAELDDSSCGRLGPSRDT
ncbi:MAG TPA: hypothetical protein VFI44_03835, partial [Ornithinibacter sp.]|nr:hypothetical protein [Ornithinibacter sp.]